MAQLSEAQLSDLRGHAELVATVPGFFFAVHGYQEIWQIYGLLSPAQRAGVSQGGLHLYVRELSPPAQRQFANFLVLKARDADIPETAYPGAELALREGPDHDLTCQADTPR